MLKTWNTAFVGSRLAQQVIALRAHVLPILTIPIVDGISTVSLSLCVAAPVPDNSLISGLLESWYLHHTTTAAPDIDRVGCSGIIWRTISLPNEDQQLD